MNHRRCLVGLASCAALVAVPASAQAATVTPNKACYNHVPTRGSEPVVLTVAGGTPGANFIVAATVPGKGLGSGGSATGTFDAAGNGTAQITNVSPPSGTIDPTPGQTLNLTIQDYGAGGQAVAAGAIKVTNVAVDVSTKPVSPRKKRAVSVSATPFANQVLYGFVVKKNSSKVLRKVRLGKADGCGYVKSKAVVAPRSYRRGTYRFYINAGQKLNKSLAIGTTFRIFRRF